MAAFPLGQSVLQCPCRPWRIGASRSCGVSAEKSTAGRRSSRTNASP